MSTLTDRLNDLIKVFKSRIFVPIVANFGKSFI